MIYVTGDLHGELDIGKLNSRRFPHNRSLTKEDLVIVAGDFGLVWGNGKDEAYWRKWLSRKNFTTLFIDGNHENFDLLDAYPVEYWNGGKVHRIEDDILHLMRGQVFTIQGLKLFTFGGAASHDKAYRKEHISWWPREMPSAEEYAEGLANLARHDGKVDYILTHTCPTSILAMLNDREPTGIEKDELTEYLESVKRSTAYKAWGFGHFHRDLPLPGGFRLLYQDVKRLTELGEY